MGVMPQLPPGLMDAFQRIRSRADTMIRRVTGIGGATAGVGLRVRVPAAFDEEHEDVEVMEPYGFASQPPDGMDGMLLCSGGDAAHAVLLSVGQQSLRIQGLASGDVAIYVGSQSDDGSRIVCRAAGGVEVQSAPAGTVRLGPEALPARAVARLEDQITVNPPDAAALAAFVTAWNATQPAGGPVLALPGVTLAAPTGQGSITSAGTQVEST